jgi:hypothetical protein
MAVNFIPAVPPEIGRYAPCFIGQKIGIGNRSGVYLYNHPKKDLEKRRLGSTIIWGYPRLQTIAPMPSSLLMT